MFAKTVTRVIPRVSRRSIQTSSVARTEGAASSSGSFGKKEKAVENQWARSHDQDLLEKLRKSLQENEKNTADIKKQLSELEASVNKKSS